MRTTTALVAVLGLIAAPGSVSPVAGATDDWSLGATFQVGGVDFRVGWHDADHHRGLYVRAETALHGRHHFAFCFRDGDHLYHHPACPLVRRHFRRHDVHPERALHRHGPPHRPSFERGYPGRGHGKAKGRRFRGSRGPVAHPIPPGHLPPPGACRIWYPGVPPGHQPPPVDCGYAYAHAPYGSFVVSGGY